VIVDTGFGDYLGTFYGTMENEAGSVSLTHATDVSFNFTSSTLMCQMKIYVKSVATTDYKFNIWQYDGIGTGGTLRNGSVDVRTVNHDLGGAVGTADSQVVNFSPCWDMTGTSTIQVIGHEASTSHGINYLFGSTDLTPTYVSYAGVPIAATLYGVEGEWVGSSAVGGESCEGQSDPFALVICKIYTFLFVPNSAVLNTFENVRNDLATTKFPFAYFYLTQQALTSIEVTSTTPVMTLPFNGHDLTFLSASSGSSFMGSTNWNFIQTLLEVAIWMSVAYYIFDRIRGLSSTV